MVGLSLSKNESILVSSAVVNPVVVIDSGVGGLTVFDAIREQLPHLPVAYCFDNAAFPYGEKSEAVVIERICFCIDRLYEHLTPSMIVVACNTASTIVLPTLRAALPVPVVGVVPAIKPAAEASRKRCIGILATPGTIKRAYTTRLVSVYANDCRVICVGSAELVYMAEEKLQGKPICAQKLKQIIQPFFQESTVPDYIVLGCTHFPWLVKELDQYSHGYAVNWVDSGHAIARRVQCLLNEPANVATYHFDAHSSCTHSFFTKAQPLPAELLNEFVKRGLSTPCLLDDHSDTGLSQRFLLN